MRAKVPDSVTLRPIAPNKTIIELDQIVYLAVAEWWNRVGMATDFEDHGAVVDAFEAMSKVVAERVGKMFETSQKEYDPVRGNPRTSDTNGA